MSRASDQTVLTSVELLLQDDAEKQRCVDAAAAEVQSILQGQRTNKGPVYQPPSQRSFNAVGPPPQVRCRTLSALPGADTAHESPASARG